MRTRTSMPTALIGASKPKRTWPQRVIRVMFTSVRTQHPADGIATGGQPRTLKNPSSGRACVRQPASTGGRSDFANNRPAPSEDNHRPSQPWLQFEPLRLPQIGAGQGVMRKEPATGSSNPKPAQPDVATPGKPGFRRTSDVTKPKTTFQFSKAQPIPQKLTTPDVVRGAPKP